MREALAARPDDDFVLSAPVRRKSAIRPKPKKIRASERVMSFVLCHPRQIAAAVLLTGCGGVIAWNALVHQTAPHPAPLFTQRDVAPVPMPTQSRLLPPARPAPAFDETQAFTPVLEAPASHAPAPSPQPSAPTVSTPKPPPRGGIADLIRNGGDAGPAAAASPRVAQPAPQAAPGPSAKPPTIRDPIAEIIRMGGPVPKPPANVGRLDAGDMILAGQRALAKLGYGVKPDGVMGAGTRQAIERFEQDRRLPVTGEFSARTMRELSAASGIAVQ